jgi:arylsulfatase A-like enzyme
MSEPRGTDGRPNILLVVLDSVRVDRVGDGTEPGEPMPYLEDLASDARYFENAYTTGSWTVPAHGSIFTGKLPRQHGAHAGAEYLDVNPSATLAGTLSDGGYTTLGFSPNPWITPEFGFAAGFDEFEVLMPELPFSTSSADPRTILENPSFVEILRWLVDGNPVKRLTNGLYEKFFHQLPYLPGEQVNEAVLDRLSTADEPWFAFVNLMDAHEPYGMQPDFLSPDQDIDEDTFAFEWNLYCYENGPDPGTHQSIRTYYDSAVSYLDRRLEELLSAVDFEETFLVVVSDHGQSLGEKNYWGHGTHLTESLIEVPLVVRSPGDKDLTLKPTEIVDLSDIPDMITDLVGVDTEQMSWKSNIDRFSDVAVAESLGPHQQVDFLPEGISLSGYRSVCTTDGCLVTNLDTGERKYIGDNPDERELERLCELNKKVLQDVEQSDGNVTNNVSTMTERRLSDLGYM